MTNKEVRDNVVEEKRDDSNDLYVRLSVQNVHYWCMQAINQGRDVIDVQLAHANTPTPGWSTNGVAAALVKDLPDEKSKE